MRPAPRPSPRVTTPRPLAAWGAALVLPGAALWCAPALAGSTPPPETQPWLQALGLGVLLLMVLGGGALLATLRRRREPEHDTAHTIARRHARGHDAALKLAGLTGLGHRAPGMSAAGPEGTLQAAEEPAPAALLDAAVSLDLPPLPQLPERGLDYLDTTLVVKACPQCDRVYDISGEYCPRDGQPLHVVEDWEGAQNEAQSEMRCPTCEALHEPGSTWCPDDGARLTPDDPHMVGWTPVGVCICPQCHREYLPDLTRCPHDDRPLLPMLGRRTCGLPITGVGPRRRVCPDCGAQYSLEAHFCGYDGAELVNMN